MAWFVLIVAGLMEIAWALALKRSEGLTRLWPTLLFAVALPLSMTLLMYSLKSLPVGTAYAVWVGIGAAGVAIVGMIWFQESATPAKIICLLLIILGVIGLRISEGSVAE